MSTTTQERHHSPPSLPPISMFTSRTQAPNSPPTSGYDNKPLLPKPLRTELLLSPPHQQYYNKSSSSSSSSASQTPSSLPPALPQQQHTNTDQNTLWALFNQFQQQQQQKSSSKEERRSSDTTQYLSSEEVLAEKRRRNAGASARFRDRRKQRERELQDKCHELEQRSKEFENALRRVDPNHPLLSSAKIHVDYSASASSPPPQQNDLVDRVGQLEHLMTRFKQEKETDVQKLDELEKENKYLKSLLVPVSLNNNDDINNRLKRLKTGKE